MTPGRSAPSRGAVVARAAIFLGTPKSDLMQATNVIAPAPEPPPLSALREIRGRGRWRGKLALMGPAFVAAVAYIDPGNFATNISGGAKFGYLLVWVIVAANLMAMMVQYLSA